MVGRPPVDEHASRSLLELAQAPSPPLVGGMQMHKFAAKGPILALNLKP